MLLGLRLAVGTGGQRARSVTMVIASAVSSMVLLLVWGIATSQVGTTTAFPFHPGVVSLLIAGTIGMVALPVLVFVATIARLSAQVRDRRLSNLRLLGLSAAQTRLVAATEVGVASLLGSMAGAVAFVVSAPVVSRIDVAGRDWTSSSLTPPALAWICVLAVVPAMTVLTAALPQRLSSGRALSQVRQSDVRSVRLLRLVPLVLGFALCWASRSPLLDRKPTLPPGEVPRDCCRDRSAGGRHASGDPRLRRTDSNTGSAVGSRPPGHPGRSPPSDSAHWRHTCHRCAHDRPLHCRGRARRTCGLPRNSPIHPRCRLR